MTLGLGSPAPSSAIGELSDLSSGWFPAYPPRPEGFYLSLLFPQNLRFCSVGEKGPGRLYAFLCQLPSSRPAHLKDGLLPSTALPPVFLMKAPWRFVEENLSGLDVNTPYMCGSQVFFTSPPHSASSHLLKLITQFFIPTCKHSASLPCFAKGEPCSLAVFLGGRVCLSFAFRLVVYSLV